MSKFCEQCKHIDEPICMFCYSTDKEGNYPSQFTFKYSIKGDKSMSINDAIVEKVDMVNHPAHYGRDGAMECIDEMIMLFGKSEVKSFCKLNAWKYRYRAADKNGAEDLAKSDWYLNKYKELNEDNKLTISTGTTWSNTIPL